METLDTILGYANRQVVLTVYRGDEMVKRDGFSFDQIRLDPDRIIFIRENRIIAELPVLLDTSPRFVQLSGFSRHYAIEHEGLRTELYFP